MKIKIAVLVISLVMCSVVFTCQKINPPTNAADYSDIKTIPLSYGTLVSVTSIPAYPEWVQMWFQDNAGNIKIVRVDFRAKKMLNDVWTVTRN